MRTKKKPASKKKTATKKRSKIQKPIDPIQYQVSLLRSMRVFAQRKAAETGANSASVEGIIWKRLEVDCAVAEKFLVAETALALWTYHPDCRCGTSPANNDLALAR